MGMFCCPAERGKGGQGTSSSFAPGGMGNVVARLLIELPISVPEHLIVKAKILDNFYIPTRYVNGHPEGAPFEHYGPLQSNEAIRYASEIIEFVRHKMA